MMKMSISSAKQIRKGQKTRQQTEYALYLFLLPAVVATLLFSYLPMFTNIMAFMDYDPTAGWMGLQSKFVGLENFRKIFNDPSFYTLVWRTLYYSIVIIVVTFPAKIIFALLLNEIRSQFFKRTVQTITYLPHFVSWVILASLIYIFLSTDSSGVINNFRSAVGLERIIFMKYEENFPIVLALSSLYKGLGWGSIIYLAAIAAVDSQMYEAAIIDGATRAQQAWYITLPSILPTVMITLVLEMGSLMGSSFDQVFNLQNSVIQVQTNTIATYTYTTGIVRQQYAISAAVGLFQGVVNCVLLLSTDFISKKLTSYGLI